jgi:hypothetical protein
LLALDFDMDQHPFFGAVEAPDLDQVIHDAAAEFRFPGDLLQFLVQGLLIYSNNIIWSWQVDPYRLELVDSQTCSGCRVDA